MTYLLALDQGTSSSRSIVFDAEGRIVAMAQREFRRRRPVRQWRGKSLGVAHGSGSQVSRLREPIVFNAARKSRTDSPSRSRRAAANP